MWSQGRAEFSQTRSRTLAFLSLHSAACNREELIKPIKENRNRTDGLNPRVSLDILTNNSAAKALAPKDRQREFFRIGRRGIKRGASPRVSPSSSETSPRDIINEMCVTRNVSLAGLFALCSAIASPIVFLAPPRPLNLLHAIRTPRNIHTGMEGEKTTSLPSKSSAPLRRFRFDSPFSFSLSLSLFLSLSLSLSLSFSRSIRCL
jgi:hypothetical protein